MRVLEVRVIGTEIRNILVQNNCSKRGTVHHKLVIVEFLADEPEHGVIAQRGRRPRPPPASGRAVRV